MLAGNKLLRIALIGPPKAGKTCFVSSAIHQYTREVHIPTLFEVHTAKPWYAPNGQFYTIHLYDCGGFGFTKETVHKIGEMDPRWKEADGIFVLFAINDLESFQEAQFLVETVLNDKAFDSKPKFLIATKGDLGSERKITTEESSQYAQDKKMGYFSTCAANNTNTTELLEKACDVIFPTLPVPVGLPSKKALSSSDAVTTPRGSSTPRGSTTPRGAATSGDDGGSTPRRKGSIFKLSSSSSSKKSDGKDTKDDLKRSSSKGSKSDLKKIDEDKDTKDDKYAELKESSTPRRDKDKDKDKVKTPRKTIKSSDSDAKKSKLVATRSDAEPKKSKTKSDKDKDKK